MFWYRNYWREYGMQKYEIFWINENSLVDTKSGLRGYTKI